MFRFLFVQLLPIAKCVSTKIVPMTFGGNMTTVETNHCDLLVGPLFDGIVSHTAYKSDICREPLYFLSYIFQSSRLVSYMATLKYDLWALIC